MRLEAKEITGCVPIEEFDCNGDGKQCVPLAQVCDGKNDCEHWQDEASQICNKSEFLLSACLYEIMNVYHNYTKNSLECR